MIYRNFPKTNTPVSVVSLGAEHLLQVDRATCIDVVSAAIDHEMNYIDLFMSEDYVRDNIGAALKGRRDKVMIAGHLGNTQKEGQAFRTRELGLCEQYFDELLTRLDTDYIDILMLHNIDELEDAKTCLDPDGFLDLAQKYLKAGKARMLGFSSHSPKVASYLANAGIFDATLFSINPLFDLMPEEATLEEMFDEGRQQETAQHATAAASARTAFYRQCEAQDIGIVVMKAYAAGAMFKQGWTPEQCIAYALSRPGVVSVAAGCRSVAEVEAAAAYVNATEAQRDYTLLMQSAHWNAEGLCMYCNHCLPCAAQLDIAAITRLLHRFQEGDHNAREAYRALAHNGGECVACGGCATRCPFNVDAPGNMRLAHELMG